MTPQISEGDTVVLEINQEVSSVSPRAVPGAVDLVLAKKLQQVIAKDGKRLFSGVC